MLIMAKSNKGKAAEMLISKIFTKPTIFKFGEFLQVDNFKAVSQSNYSAWKGQQVS